MRDLVVSFTSKREHLKRDIRSIRSRLTSLGVQCVLVCRGGASGALLLIARISRASHRPPSWFCTDFGEYYAKNCTDKPRATNISCTPYVGVQDVDGGDFQKVSALLNTEDLSPRTRSLAEEDGFKGDFIRDFNVPLEVDSKKGARRQEQYMKTVLNRTSKTFDTNGCREVLRLYGIDMKKLLDRARDSRLTPRSRDEEDALLREGVDKGVDEEKIWSREKDDPLCKFRVVMLKPGWPATRSAYARV